MGNKIEALTSDMAEIAMMNNSEVPTIKFSEICNLIQIMEDELEHIKPDEKDDELWNAYFGYNAALNSVKKYFIGDWKVDNETGEIVTTFMGKRNKNV